MLTTLGRTPARFCLLSLAIATLSLIAEAQTVREPIRARWVPPRAYVPPYVMRLPKTRPTPVNWFGVRQRSVAEIRQSLTGADKQRFGTPPALNVVYARLSSKTKAGELPADDKENLVDLARFECPKDGPAGCVPPVTRYESLLPEIDAFIRFAWPTVLGAKPDALVVARPDPLSPLDNKKDPFLKSGGHFFFNFACRLISKYLPELAKVDRVVVRPASISIVGDWDAPVPAEGPAIEQELGKKPGTAKKAAVTEYAGPPAKEEVIEVCSITHPQMEMLVKQDLGILAKRAKKAAIAAPAITESPIASSTTSPFVSIGRRPSDMNAEVDKILENQKMVEQAAHFNNETYRSIADRFVGFYRKGGKARAFEQGVADQSNAGVKLDEKSVVDSASGSADQKTLSKNIKAQNKSGDKRKKREVLQRFVDQWTDGWEYKRLTSYLGAVDTGQRLGLSDKYQSVEKVVAREFWDSCDDLWDVCKKPKFKHEIEACIKCAYHAYLNHCLDGKVVNAPIKDAKGKVILKSTCAPARMWMNDEVKGFGGEVSHANFGEYTTTLSDSHVNGGKNFEITHRQGATLRNWIVLRLKAEANVIPFHEPSIVKVLDHFKGRLANAVVWMEYPPYEVPGTGYISGRIRKFIQQLPITPWQRCYLLGSRSYGNKLPPAAIDSKGCLPSQAKSTNEVSVRGELGLWRDKIDWRTFRFMYPAINYPYLNDYLNYLAKRMTNNCNASNRPFDFWKDLEEKEPNTMVWKSHSAGIGSANMMADGVCRLLNDTTTTHRGGNAASRRREVREIDAAKELAPVAAAPADGPDSGGIGGMIVDAAGPIIGKVLSLLIKGDIEQVMRVLAKAAGMTPEQAIDCEDPEYRFATMKMGWRDASGNVNRCEPGDESIAARSGCKSDNKRACLTKIFAKNFVTMLENIIVMVGNKLVDWAVDALRAALEGAKLGILSAAGSVPFVGGILTTIVEIAWEVVMNFGAKALLKGLVVSQLPTWLRVKELASKDLDKLIEDHPIISLVAGIILDLIQEALAAGSKGWVEVGFASALNAIQSFLQKKPSENAFWLRAFMFAKRELAAEAGGGEPPPVGEQVKRLVRAMVKGIGASLAGRMSQRARNMFEPAFDALLTEVESLVGGDALDRLTRDAKGYLVELLGKTLAPVVIPIVTAFVDMPEWVKEVLLDGAELISKALSGTAPVTIALLIGTQEAPGVLRKTAGSVRREVIARLDVRSTELKDLLLGVYDWVVRFVVDFNSKETAALLQNPIELLKGLLGLVRDKAAPAVGSFLAAKGFTHEKDLLEGALGKAVDIIVDDDARKEFFGATATPATGAVEPLPAVSRVLEGAAEFIIPYAKGRLGALVEGTGLERAVDDAVTALLDPKDGFIAKKWAGADGRQTTAQWLTANAKDILDRVGSRLVGIIESRVRKMAGANAIAVAAATSAVSTLIVVVKAAVDSRLSSADRVVQLVVAGAWPIARAIGEEISKLVASRGILAGERRDEFEQNVTTLLDSVLDLFRKTSGLKAAGTLGAAWTSFVSAVRAAAIDVVSLVISDTAERTRLVGLLSANTVSASDFGAALGAVVAKLVGSSDAVSQALKEAVVAAFELFKFGAAPLASTASAAVTRLLGASSTTAGTVRALVAKAIEAFVPDATARGVITQAANGVFTVLTNVLAGQGVPGVVKTLLTTVANGLRDYLRSRLAAALPASSTDPIRVFALKGFDTLASMLRFVFGETCTQAAPCFNWNDLSTSSGLLKSLVNNAVGVAADLIGAESKSELLKTLAKNFAGVVTSLLEQWDSLGNKLKNGSGTSPVMGLVLDTAVSPLIRGLLNQTLRDGATLRVFQFLADQLITVLKDPAVFGGKLGKLILPSATKADWAPIVKGLVAGIIAEVAKDTGVSPTIKEIVGQVAQVLAK